MKDNMAKPTKFLAVSLIVVLTVSVAIFSFLALFMKQQSTKTIRDMSKMYMSGISEQIAMHFETTIDLRLDQLDALIKTVVSEDVHTDAAQQESLIYNAKAREFSYLAFYYADGSFEMLYGSPVEVTDPGPFMASLKAGENKVAVGTDASGKNVVLMGVPSKFAPNGDNPCIALVAGLPTDYISETLFLEEDSSHTYSYIIRKDGSFVIRTGGPFRDSYFTRVRNIYTTAAGKTPEQYISELSEAMNNEEDYSAEIRVNNVSRQMYSTKLSQSEWFLITFMPYDTLDEMINGFTGSWTVMVFLGCAAAIAVLLVAFSKYFQITKRQMQDITKAQREAEAANHAKSEFLSNMSHDIRTPMNAIVGMTAIATANIDNKEQVKNCLKKITLSSRHLLGLINDVLDMSKIESGKMTLNIDQVSLREVMDSIVNIAQPQVKAKRQQFNVFIHNITTENVCCDSVRLNQVLINFLSNAIKFTPEGGSIQMSLSETESPKGEDYVRIHLMVKDNGIGMTEEFKEKIFESFTREDSTRVHRTEGTGLGMAITKCIVDVMGGTIEVDSELGKGTEFRVILDLEKADIQDAEMILPEWNMLVVDDDQQLCESATASLEDIGVKADWVLSGEEAVQLADQRKKEGRGYHIVLLDWKLPGIDGIATAREIRRRLGGEMPILLISAYDWSEIESEAREAGISGFIAKPLFKSTLYYGLRPYAGIVEEETPEEDMDLKGKHILLAEDNDLNWEIAEELLTSELGLELERAENGEICVEKFRSSPVGCYDGILMDIRMPVMSGYEAADAIRSLNRADSGLPIIAMTADAFSEDIKRCLDHGMNAHISKPIDVRDVARILKRYL